MTYCNSPCPACDSPAYYVGLNAVECSNHRCLHFSAREVSIDTSRGQDGWYWWAPDSPPRAISFSWPSRSAFDIEHSEWPTSPRNKAKKPVCCAMLGPPTKSLSLMDRLKEALGPEVKVTQVRLPINSTHDEIVQEFKVEKAQPVKPKMAKPNTFIYHVRNRTTNELETYTSVAKRGNSNPEQWWMLRSEVVMAVDENGNVEVVKNRRGPVGPAEKIKENSEATDQPKKQATPADTTNWPSGHSND